MQDAAADRRGPSLGRRSRGSALTGELKAVSTGKKGRELFHPLRLALTGRDSGPEMAGLVARMGKDRAIQRLKAAAKR